MVARITIHGSLVILVARKANVVLTLQYHGPNPGGTYPADVQAVAASHARILLHRVTLN